MVTLGRLFLGTLTAAFGALIVLMFQGQIVRYFDPDRLVADVYVGAWMPLPIAGSFPSQILKLEGLSDYYAPKIQSGDPLSLVQLDVRNPGAKDVSEIKIDTGFSTVAIAVFKDSKLTGCTCATRTIQLPAMKPGDTFRIFVWTDREFTDPYTIERWQTFSSQGPITIKLHTAEESIFNNSTDRTINAIFSWFFGITIVVSVILLLILFTYSNQCVMDL